MDAAAQAWRWVAAVAVAIAASPAAAGPLGDALARHAEADVAQLRGALPEVAARCTLGAVFARRGDPARAALYLAGCDAAAVPDDVAAAVRAAERDARRRLAAGRLVALELVGSAAVELDGLAGESIAAPSTIWLAAGNHDLHVRAGDRRWTQRVIAEPGKPAIVVLEPPRGATRGARSREVDFATDDPSGGLGEVISGPPPPTKYGSMMSDRYRGIAAPATEPPIEDPLAARVALAPPGAAWLGVRLGGGMFGDGAAAARAGLAVAVAARWAVSPRGFVAARADLSGRGGTAMTGAAPALGASAGVGLTVYGGRDRRELGLALIGQLRGDLRLTDRRDAAAVRRAGLGVVAGAELALPSSPFTVGLRVEQAVTELVAGARDRAVLAELGVDLR